MELCFSAQHAHPRARAHTFRGGFKNSQWFRPQPPCLGLTSVPCEDASPLPVPRAGAALVLTALSDLRGAHSKPRPRAPLHPWKVRLVCHKCLLFGLETWRQMSFW